MHFIYIHEIRDVIRPLSLLAYRSRIAHARWPRCILPKGSESGSDCIRSYYISFFTCLLHIPLFSFQDVYHWFPSFLNLHVNINTQSNIKMYWLHKSPSINSGLSNNQLMWIVNAYTRDFGSGTLFSIIMARLTLIMCGTHYLLMNLVYDTTWTVKCMNQRPHSVNRLNINFPNPCHSQCNVNKHTFVTYTLYSKLRMYM